MTLRYAGIRVRDLARSVRFFTRGLGLEVTVRGAMGHGGRYVGLRDPASGQRIELNYYPPGSPYATRYVPGDGLDHLGFEVADVDGTYRALLELGARPAIPVWTEAGRYRIGFVRDPDGHWIELQGPRPRAPRGPVPRRENGTAPPPRGGRRRRASRRPTPTDPRA